LHNEENANTEKNVKEQKHKHPIFKWNREKQKSNKCESPWWWEHFRLCYFYFDKRSYICLQWYIWSSQRLFLANSFLV